MALLKAVLMYQAVGVGSDEVVPIGATDNPRVVKQLADHILEGKQTEAETWRGVDEGVYFMILAEAERLGRILRLLLHGRNDGEALS